jgi:ribonuclease P protein component
MLPTNRRVKKELFPEIMKKGLFLHGVNFYFKVLERKDDKPSLFSFVVPAKIVKTSVKRHLIKRKMSAVIEGVIKNIKPGYSVLVFLKKNIKPFDKAQGREILSLLTKMLHSKDDF